MTQELFHSTHHTSCPIRDNERASMASSWSLTLPFSAPPSLLSLLLQKQLLLTWWWHKRRTNRVSASWWVTCCQRRWQTNKNSSSTAWLMLLSSSTITTVAIRVVVLQQSGRLVPALGFSCWGVIWGVHCRCCSCGLCVWLLLRWGVYKY